MELATDIDITGVRTHGEAGEQAALDQLVRVPAHDVPVLAGPGFTLVGVDDQIVRAAVRLLRHERPFEAGREAGPAAAAHARLTTFTEDPVAALSDGLPGALPAPERQPHLQPRNPAG